MNINKINIIILYIIHINIYLIDIINHMFKIVKTL